MPSRRVIAALLAITLALLGCDQATPTLTAIAPSSSFSVQPTSFFCRIVATAIQAHGRLAEAVKVSDQGNGPGASLIAREANARIQGAMSNLPPLPMPTHDSHIAMSLLAWVDVGYREITLVGALAPDLRTPLTPSVEPHAALAEVDQAIERSRAVSRSEDPDGQSCSVHW